MVDIKEFTTNVLKYLYCKIVFCYKDFFCLLSEIWIRRFSLEDLISIKQNLREINTLLYQQLY